MQPSALDLSKEYTVHLCVASRGIKDTNSSTTTVYFSGDFENEKTQRTFLELIK